jgi:hypothetical protein
MQFTTERSNDRKLYVVTFNGSSEEIRAMALKATMCRLTEGVYYTKALEEEISHADDIVIHFHVMAPDEAYEDSKRKEED